jgi:hypothetical protein
MIKLHYRPIVYSSAKTLKLTALNQLTIGSLEVYGHSLTPLIPAIILDSVVLSQECGPSRAEGLTATILRLAGL